MTDDYYDEEEDEEKDDADYEFSHEGHDGRLVCEGLKILCFPAAFY